MLAFGVPDESHYAFPFTAFFRKHATLIAGAATDRAQALAAAREYLREHRSCSRPTSPTCCRSSSAQEAFELAVDPVVGRLKVVLEVALMRFTATLEDRYVIVPFDVRAQWGEARPPVAGTINGVPFRTRIAVYGGQYVLGLTNAIRKQAGVVQGDEVEIELERDDAPREVELPPELEAVLTATCARRSTRSRFTHRREYAEWVAEAKRPETRARAGARRPSRSSVRQAERGRGRVRQAQLAGRLDPGVGVVLAREVTAPIAVAT